MELYKLYKSYSLESLLFVAFPKACCLISCQKGAVSLLARAFLGILICIVSNLQLLHPLGVGRGGGQLVAWHYLKGHRL